jgi:hypothetical protein
LCQKQKSPLSHESRQASGIDASDGGDISFMVLTQAHRHIARWLNIWDAFGRFGGAPFDHNCVQQPSQNWNNGLVGGGVRNLDGGHFFSPVFGGD